MRSSIVLHRREEDPRVLRSITRHRIEAVEMTQFQLWFSSVVTGARRSVRSPESATIGVLLIIITDAKCDAASALSCIPLM